MHANKQKSHARRRPVLFVLALVGLISAAQMKEPIQLVSAQTVAGSWSYTGSLNTARSSNGATLLPNGKVLVAGISCTTVGCSYPNSAELYDPATGTWSVTGSINVTRWADTATPLPNGQVLVVGGETDTNLTDTAELYDPTTGMWRLTGNLNEARAFHTATLLRNGKVLVTGGISGSYSVLNTAELYDPATGLWAVADALDTRRFWHTATLLQDGKVLVAGGCLDGDCDIPLASAQLYDPNTGAWTVTGRANALRERHTATLLPDGRVLVAGGGRQFQNLHTSELYDPAKGSWSFTNNLSYRTNHTATLLPNGRVLVAGGVGFPPSADPALHSAFVYDPATGVWGATASLNTARSGHAATLLTNGNVLVVGGGSDGSAELYDSETLDPAPRIFMASVSGKKLFLTGENFHPGAAILLNGEEQKSKNDEQNPQTIMIGKKAGKKIKAGDHIQVRNPNGSISAEFTFTGS